MSENSRYDSIPSNLLSHHTHINQPNCTVLVLKLISVCYLKWSRLPLLWLMCGRIWIKFKSSFWINRIVFLTRAKVFSAPPGLIIRQIYFVTTPTLLFVRSGGQTACFCRIKFFAYRHCFSFGAHLFVMLCSIIGLQLRNNQLRRILINIHILWVPSTASQWCVIYNYIAFRKPRVPYIWKYDRSQTHTTLSLCVVDLILAVKQSTGKKIKLWLI